LYCTYTQVSIMSSILQLLQTKHLIWQANSLSQDPGNSIVSGFSELDGKLNGGWPDKGIIELQCSPLGIGEVRLLLPALRQLSLGKGLGKELGKPEAKTQEPLYIWVAPPGRLNGQVLAEAGLPLANTLVASDISAKEAFWLSEKSLRSGCCAAVVLWCDELEPNQAKRLQLAAKEGNSLGFVIRPPSKVKQSLPVSIRMAATPHVQGLQLNITKRLGGNPVSPFMVDMSQYWPELTEPKLTESPKQVKLAPVTRLQTRRSATTQTAGKSR
ncbi:MAG: translesion DNA synthesis-associated protein ImuA, partial [Psychrosphaera sp.]|nr:translesion DNA synthesis-associated protein ImuA [Psychrosphaera sp.]